ncbi:Flavin-dependent halogenase aclH [Cladobotryum mycophilum]|uniref:Flavin-dependent halogenase aclH n=1 Tax=Cladobotryum mycophilum TaxID=491253 RepID=A0ABR0SHQ1_9HYPO
MSIPESCEVLVIGGGPAGSFTAAALAREGVDVVALEADKFPRYHIGESMLPSMRHYLKFIDLYETFNAHGFTRKNGAAFRLTKSQPEVSSDFLEAGGPEGYAWNVVRSEFDDMLFKHAAASGAHTFDQTRVEEIQFESEPDSHTKGLEDADRVTSPGRPVSATWSRKDGTSGTISFKYLVDASGRRGLLSTKYLKNRKFNDSLKNIASWSYWKGGETYAEGSHTNNYTYFEALQDASGWCWYIPLHDGTHSVGFVRNMHKANAEKQAAGCASSKEFYMKCLDLVPRIKKLLSAGELASDIKSASDWSYSASSYAIPNARIAGDAGCFIDPFFSSGVHLAIVGGMSAATTIMASIRGDCDEETAGAWHSKKVAASYTRFFLMVIAAMKQIWSQEDPVIQDIDEEGYQRAFDLFRPVIQGTVDANPNKQLSESDIPKMVEFSFKAFANISTEKKDALIEKLKHVDLGANDSGTLKIIAEIEKSLTPEEVEVLDILRSRRMFSDEGFDIDNFTFDSIDGLVPNMVRGKLGLVKAVKPKANSSENGSHLYSVSWLESKPSGLKVSAEVPNLDQSTTTIEVQNDASNGVEATSGPSDNFHSNEDVASTSLDVDLIAKQLRTTLQASYGDLMEDELGRHSVISALNASAEDYEEPYDLMMRLANAGNQTTMIKVGFQLGIFKALGNGPSPLSIEQLCEPTGADPRLVRRILRYLAANRFIKEVGKGVFAANKTTQYLADPRMEGSMEVYFGVVNPMLQEMPDFLAEHKFQERVGLPCVFSRMAKTDVDFYNWLPTQPQMIKNFQGMMAVPRIGDWLSAVPFSEIHTHDSARAVFVDVGGNIGHQCAQVIKAHPELAGRIVLQDLPEVIDAAPMIDGVKTMKHDFFTPQPIQGARYYYLRTILHNWEDSKAVEILRNLVSAMTPDSFILIDEIAVPTTNAHIWPAVQDLLMMKTFGARERTVDEWTALLDQAGLKIADIKTYALVMRASIIFAQPK